jgi:hypothetical protein
MALNDRMLIIGSFGKTLLFIKLIFALAAAGALAAQDTSATLRGEVRDITGTVVPATMAELKLEDAPGTILSVRTDREGKFRFAVLPGTYTLRLKQQGFRITTLRSIHIAPGEQKVLTPLRLDLERPCGFPLAVEYLQLTSAERGFGILSGSVRNDVGPVDGATIKLICAVDKICGEAKTDSNGGFILFNLQPGVRYTLDVAHSGFYPWQWMGFEVQADYDAAYGPITLEECPNGNCDPRLRVERPLALCE